MAEVKDRCTSVDGNDTWGVVGGVDGTYSIRDLDAGEMDDILSVTSSDLEDSAVLQNKKGSVNHSNNTTSLSTPLDSLSNVAPAMTTARSNTWTARLTKLQSVILGISLVAGLINMGLLTVFIRDINSFTKNNELECSSLAFKDRLACQFDAYMGHRAHAYEAAYVKKTPLPSTLASYYPSFPSLEQYYEVCQKKLKFTYAATSNWVSTTVRRENFESVKEWTKNAKETAEDRITAFYSLTKQRFDSYKETQWPRQRQSLFKFRVNLQAAIHRYQRKMRKMYPLEFPHLRKFSVPRIWYKSSDKLRHQYHKILDLLRVRM